MLIFHRFCCNLYTTTVSYYYHVNSTSSSRRCVTTDEACFSHVCHGHFTKVRRISRCSQATLFRREHSSSRGRERRGLVFPHGQSRSPEKRSQMSFGCAFIISLAICVNHLLSYMSQQTTPSSNAETQPWPTARNLKYMGLFSNNSMTISLATASAAIPGCLHSPLPPPFSLLFSVRGSS